MIGLLVEPGDYSCSFLHAEQVINGSLELRAADRVRGVAYDWPDKWKHESGSAEDGAAVYSWSPSSQTYERLDAQLRDGRSVALFNVSVRQIMHGRARISAEVGICGLGLPNEQPIEFHKASFQVTGLTELVSVAPIASTQRPTEASQATHYGFDWNPDCDQDWVSANERYTLASGQKSTCFAATPLTSLLLP